MSEHRVLFTYLAFTALYEITTLSDRGSAYKGSASLGCNSYEAYYKKKGGCDSLRDSDSCTGLTMVRRFLRPSSISTRRD